jgi:hypothetical protein
MCENYAIIVSLHVIIIVSKRYKRMTKIRNYKEFNIGKIHKEEDLHGMKRVGQI